MAVVVAMSSSAMSANNTGGVLALLLGWVPGLRAVDLDLMHLGLRKAAHVTEYGILAGLWRHSFVGSGMVRPAVGGVLAVTISLICAVIDETRQSFLATSTGAIGDVGLDVLGALTVVVAAQVGWWKAVDIATGALLWIAVLGGVGALALDAAAGSGGGALWLTVPAAAALLAYRWRRRVSRS
jgi:VanZ family protein